MAQENLSPRQKMISLMYLVLMALLALNVSKEVLDGFLIVNESLHRNNDNFSLKIEQIYDSFERDFAINPEEVGPNWEKAQHARQLSKELLQYLDSIRIELISITEKIPEDSAKNINLYKLENKDNYDVPTRYFIGSSADGSTGKAGQLRLRMDDFRLQMMQLVDTRYQHKIESNLQTGGDYFNADHEKQNWELHHFYYNILVADLAIINTIISEVQHTEFDVVNALYDDITAEDFHYDHIAARVISKSNYLFMGENYEAEIIVSASDSTQTPEAYYKLGADSLALSELASAIKISGSGGKITLSIPAKEEGTQRFAGLIKLKNKQGDESIYPFSDEYIVARPSLTVSAKQMNVLYSGIENPISISVPGVPKNDILPVITSGELKPDKKTDGWIATVPAGYRTANIKVSVKVGNTYKEMGVQTFRVKKLPDPIATIANKNQGFVSKEILKVAGGLEARMPDDFEYNLSFKVKSFIMTTQRGFTMIHANSKNALLTDEMKKNIDMTNRGQNILFEEIIVEDPAGEERKLAPIVLSIN